MKDLNNPDLKEFLHSVSYYPPVSGKIYPLHTDKDAEEESGLPKWKNLSVSYMAEEYVNKSFDTMKHMDAENFIHQFTVQGRLLDDFKYAAIPMLLAVPHKYDWNTRLLDVHWHRGKGSDNVIPPLIHDAGQFNYFADNINKNWKVKGRTDFTSYLQTNPFNPDPAYSVNNDIALIIEKDRILRSAVFYQRAALAMHCDNGSQPATISKETTEKLVVLWSKLKAAVSEVLNENNLGDVTKTQWFMDKPILDTKHPLGTYWKRHEAPAKPIMTDLKRIEEEKWTSLDNAGQLAENAANLMDAFSKQVDKVTGLAKYKIS